MINKHSLSSNVDSYKILVVFVGVDSTRPYQITGTLRGTLNKEDAHSANTNG